MNLISGIQINPVFYSRWINFSHFRAKLAAVRVAEGLPVVKHRNGKIDLGTLLDSSVSREYVCPKCHHTFAYRSVLNRHVKRIHEKHLMPRFKCSKCNYNTVWKDQMRSHFSVVHQVTRGHSLTASCKFDQKLTQQYDSAFLILRPPAK